MKLEELKGYETKKAMLEDYLQRFLYFLMRDHVSTGTIAECVNNVALTKDKETDFCNDHLAAMAFDYAERILQAKPTMGVDKGYMKLENFKNEKSKK